MKASKCQIKRTGKRTALLLAVLLLLCTSLLLTACFNESSTSESPDKITSNPSDKPTNDPWSFQFRLNNDGKGYTVIDAATVSSTENPHVTFPATHEGLPVTAIETTSLRYSPIQTVVIPDSVSTIGKQVFMGCLQLKSVTLGKGITTIGESAFSDCVALTNIILPDTLVSIQAHAFKGCAALSAIALPDSLASIGESAFAECKTLTTVTFGNGAVTIGKDAFLTQSITMVSVPSLESFLKISFQDVTSSPFCYSPQTVLYVNGNATTAITIPTNITEIGDNAFYGYTGLKAVTIPNHVTRIGKSAFQKTSISMLSIPDSVTEIGESAFKECKSLIELTIGKGISVIEEETFGICDNLEKIAFGANITRIHSKAFTDGYGDMNQLREVVFHGSQDQWNAIQNIYYTALASRPYLNVIYTEAPAWGDWVVTVEPTCMSEGLRVRSNSKGEVEEEILSALGHSPVTDPAVAPKCEEPGLTEGSHCSVCNETIVSQRPDPATGHSYKNGGCIYCYQPQPTDVWDGNPDTSWYKADQTTFTITTSKQLAGLATLVNMGTTMKDKTIYLDADLDLNNKPWTPIGYTRAFEGVFDGKNHTISNLKITFTTGYLGLFGNSQGTIKNVTLKNVDVSPSSLGTAGTLLGYNKSIDWSETYGTVSNCHAGGTITITTASTNSRVVVGGLIGCHEPYSILEKSSADVAITLTTCENDSNQSIFVGGLVGDAQASFSQCYATGNISATTKFAPIYAGGLVGTGASSHATNCYATGNVSISSTNDLLYAGGMFGTLSGSLNKNVEILYCYATGNVSAVSSGTSSSGKSYAGGLIGMARLSVAIVQCYATGDAMAEVGVSPTGLSHAYAGTLVGGLPSSGSNNITVSGCYYAAEQTRTLTGSKTTELTDGMAQYLSTMQTQNFFTDMIQWSASVWNFENGKNPTLK